MNIFKFDDYKDCIQSYVESAPQNGRGQFRAIATYLKMHPTLVSRIFNGSREKDLTFEQAADLAHFLKLNDLETDYFLLLVEQSRAGSKSLKLNIQKRKQKLRRQASELSASFEGAHEISEADRAIYYSHWYYSAIQLLTDIPGYQNVNAIATLLKLPHDTVEKAVEFLVATKMVLREHSHLACGPNWIFEPAQSPYAARHHINWRLKSIERLHDYKSGEKFLTLPVTISKKDRATIAQMILDFVTHVKKIVEPSPPEQLSVLTIDLFDVN